MNIYLVKYLPEPHSNRTTESWFRIVANSFEEILLAYPGADEVTLEIENVELIHKQPQTHKEYLRWLRNHDPITYSELTSDPTGSSGDEISGETMYYIYLVIAFALGVLTGSFI